MPEIPESLRRRSAEAKAKALGVPVETILAEMGLGVATEAAAEPESGPEAVPSTPAPAEAPAAAAPADIDGLLASASEKAGLSPKLVRRSAEARAKKEGLDLGAVLAEMAGLPAPAAAAPAAAAPAAAAKVSEVPATPVPSPVVAAETPPVPPPAVPGQGAAVVSPRPIAPPVGAPEGVRTQRLLTVVKAKAIQTVKTEPQDKVNVWPHLLLIEMVALLAMTAFLIVLSVIIQSPLLDPADFNATPNPSKAPWYFLGLQELLSYFDPQIAGVTVPTIVGLLGFMAIPYVDRNPSNKPSDRKFAIMMYTVFLAGSATLSILGVLFRGKGFNFSYPWKDGIFFDDLKDWVHFE